MCANHTAFTSRGAERLASLPASRRPTTATTRMRLCRPAFRCRTATRMGVTGRPVGLLTADADERPGSGCAPVDKPSAAFLPTTAKKQNGEYVSRPTMSLGLDQRCNGDVTYRAVVAAWETGHGKGAV